MSNYGNAFFSPDGKQYPASVVPVWLEVKERKIAGGTFSLSGVAKGTIFAAGMPVRLDKMGGTVTILPTFQVVGAVSSSAKYYLDQARVDEFISNLSPDKREELEKGYTS